MSFYVAAEPRGETHPVDEILPPAKLAVYGAQHVLAIGNANGGGVDGLLAIYGAVIVAGVVTFLAAPYFSRLLKFFPPVVTGTVITVIGVTLLPVAAQSAGGGNPSADDFGSFQNIELAGATLVFIIVLQRVFRGRFLASVAVL